MGLPEPRGERSPELLSVVDETLLIDKTRRMIRAIGLARTLIVLETLGGTVLELPTGYRWRKRDGVLAELIGQDAADAFHDEFADQGRRMLLPKADKILIQLRDHQICAEADNVSVRDQALRYRLTVRQIQNIRKHGPRAAQRRPSPQIDLFSAVEADGGGAAAA